MSWVSTMWMAVNASVCWLTGLPTYVIVFVLCAIRLSFIHSLLSMAVAHGWMVSWWFIKSACVAFHCFHYENFSSVIMGNHV